MRKIITALLIVFLLTGCLNNPQSERKVLRVYSPSVYIDETIITDFEDIYNVRVIYEEFESNEQMYTKLLSGNNYDVLVPSDYMIDRLIQENLLQKIDIDYITNFEYIKEELLNQEYDSNNEYSIPYFYGSVGILYDKNQLSLNELEEKGWNIFLEPQYKNNFYFYDSERDAFMVALKALGYSMNTSDLDQVNKAYEWLNKMADTMSPVYVLDTVIESMLDGNKAMAVMYSGDAAFIMSENEDMEFFMPKEGTNIWTDAMVISKDAESVEMAHEWINFLLDYDIAYSNSIEVGYSSPVRDVFDEISGIGGDYYGISAYSPRLDYEYDESFIHNELLRRAISELWIKVKAK